MTLNLDLLNRDPSESRKDCIGRKFDEAKEIAHKQHCDVVLKGILFKEEVNFLTSLALKQPFIYQRFGKGLCNVTFVIN